MFKENFRKALITAIFFIGGPVFATGPNFNPPEPKKPVVEYVKREFPKSKLQMEFDISVGVVLGSGNLKIFNENDGDVYKGKLSGKAYLGRMLPVCSFEYYSEGKIENGVYMPNYSERWYRRGGDVLLTKIIYDHAANKIIFIENKNGTVQRFEDIDISGYRIDDLFTGLQNLELYGQQLSDKGKMVGYTIRKKDKPGVDSVEMEGQIQFGNEIVIKGDISSLVDNSNKKKILECYLDNEFLPKKGKIEDLILGKFDVNALRIR